jgi:vesicle-fusing ATPase
MEFKIGQLQEITHAISNRVYLSRQDYARVKTQSGGKEPVYVKIKNSVFIVDEAKYLENGFAGLSKKQREFLKLSQSLDNVVMSPFQPPNTEYRLGAIKVDIVPVKLDVEKEITDEALEKIFRQLYTNTFFSRDQEVYFEFEGINYFARVLEILLMESNIQKVELPFGLFIKETDIEFFSRGPSKLKIKKQSNKLKAIFRPDFKFEDMGVGGMDKEIGDIFRRAFSSRRIPNHILEQYGIKHVKGLLLYGPPGTGKTLIARQLAKVLHAKEPKIVNGPELFNKYVGETESNVRKLFEEAKKDQVTLKEESPLHVIIFDEFDAIAKHRGMDASGTGVGDNVVNQLLAMIDGVESLDNILVIGMTNRIDLIDKAVLRPGRFEVHIEIGLPDEAGRVQILNIHTKNMRSNKLLGSDVDLASIASELKNYTGAEIEAIVKSASSFAMNRHHQLMNFNQKVTIVAPGKVEYQDFLAAMKEVRPEFGVDDNKIEVYLRDKIFNYGSRMTNILENCEKITREVNGQSLPLASILLFGAHGTGKTTLAVNVASRSKFPFIKIISAEDLIGKSEYFKTNYLIKNFEDAYKSTQSLVILDDLERLVEYVEIGSRFNNNILQSILVLIKRRPAKANHSIAIIATSSNAQFLKDFSIIKEFNIKVEVPELTFNFKGENEIGNVILQRLGVRTNSTLGQNPKWSIPIKRLIFILNIVEKNLKNGPLDNVFLEALQAVGNDHNDDNLTNYTF